MKAWDSWVGTGWELWGVYYCTIPQQQIQESLIGALFMNPPPQSVSVDLQNY